MAFFEATITNDKAAKSNPITTVTEKSIKIQNIGDENTITSMPVNTEPIGNTCQT